MRKTLLDGKAFAKGAPADLENGVNIEIEDMVFKVVRIGALAAKESSSRPKEDLQR